MISCGDGAGDKQSVIKAAVDAEAGLLRKDKQQLWMIKDLEGVNISTGEAEGLE